MSPEFFTAIHVLRALPGERHVMALHAAMFWSDERLAQAECEAAVAPAVISDLIGESGRVVSLASRRART